MNEYLVLCVLCKNSILLLFFFFVVLSHAADRKLA